MKSINNNYFDYLIMKKRKKEKKSNQDNKQESYIFMKYKERKKKKSKRQIGYIHFDNTFFKYINIMKSININHFDYLIMKKRKKKVK
jgi:hypothetical protein